MRPRARSRSPRRSPVAYLAPSLWFAVMAQSCRWLWWLPSLCLGKIFGRHIGAVGGLELSALRGDQFARLGGPSAHARCSLIRRRHSVECKVGRHDTFCSLTRPYLLALLIICRLGHFPALFADGRTARAASPAGRCQTGIWRWQIPMLLRMRQRGKAALQLSTLDLSVQFRAEARPSCIFAGQWHPPPI